MRFEELEEKLTGKTVEEIREILKQSNYREGTADWECNSYETGGNTLSIYLELDDDEYDVPENLILFTTSLGMSAEFLVLDTNTMELTKMMFEQWSEGDCSEIYKVDTIQL